MLVTHLTTLGLPSTTVTIKMYLSDVRNLHTAAGHHLLYQQQFTPYLQQFLKRIQKTSAPFRAPYIRLPITLTILSGMLTILQREINNLMSL